MRAETIITALMVCRTHYPYYFRDKTNEEQRLLIEEWSRAFGEVGDDEFMQVISKLVATERYFPTIGAILEQLRRAAMVKAERPVAITGAKKAKSAEDYQLELEWLMLLERIPTIEQAKIRYKELHGGLE